VRFFAILPISCVVSQHFLSGSMQACLHFLTNLQRQFPRLWCVSPGGGVFFSKSNAPIIWSPRPPPIGGYPGQTVFTWFRFPGSRGMHVFFTVSPYNAGAKRGLAGISLLVHDLFYNTELKLHTRRKHNCLQLTKKRYALNRLISCFFGAIDDKWLNIPYTDL